MKSQIRRNNKANFRFDVSKANDENEIVQIVHMKEICDGTITPPPFSPNSLKYARYVLPSRDLPSQSQQQKQYNK